MKKKIICIFLIMLLIIVVYPINGKIGKDNFKLLNAPPIPNPGGPYFGDEGQELLFDASASFDPDGDPLEYRWDFDADEVWDTDWSPDPIAFYEYGDDYNYLAFVQITDGINTVDAGAPTIIDNVNPIVNAGGDHSINEGEDVELTGDIDDPGFLDLHVESWDLDFGELKNKGLTPPRFTPGPGFEWDDGSGSMTIYLNLSTGSMKVNDFHFTVLKGSMGIVSYDTNLWKVSGSGTSINGQTKDYPLDKRPPGSTDTFLVTMVTSNGEFRMTYAITLDGVTINRGEMGFKKNAKNDDFPFTYTATYGDCGTYELTYYATDDDGGIHEDTCIINVANTNPVIIPFGPINGKPNEPIEISATVNDAGSDDLTFTWDFGDGTPSATNYYQNNETEPDPPEGSINGTFPVTITDTLTHTYSTKDKFSLTLTVEDDNGGSSVYSTTISTPRNRVVNNILLHLFEKIFGIFLKLML